MQSDKAIKEHGGDAMMLGLVAIPTQLIRCNLIATDHYPADAQAFLKALYLLAKEVAMTGGFFRFRKGINKHKQFSLNLIATSLEFLEP